MPCWEWSIKRGSESRAAAPKGWCPVGHRGEFPYVLRRQISGLKVGIWPNFSKSVSVDFFLCFSPKGEYMTIFLPLWRIFSPKKIIFPYYLLWILWRKIREFVSATKLTFHQFPYWQNSAPGVKNHSLTTLDNYLFRKAKLRAMRWQIYDILPFYMPSFHHKIVLFFG